MRFTVSKFGCLEQHELEFDSVKEFKELHKALSSKTNKNSINDMLHSMEIPTLFNTRVDRKLLNRI